MQTPEAAVLNRLRAEKADRIRRREMALDEAFQKLRAKGASINLLSRVFQLPQLKQPINHEPHH